jgi:hypothetical protein
MPDRFLDHIAEATSLDVALSLGEKETEEEEGETSKAFSS